MRLRHAESGGPAHPTRMVDGTADCILACPRGLVLGALTEGDPPVCGRIRLTASAGGPD
jgi:hypothetical protein